MLIDMHVHTSKISRCCRVSAEEVIKKAKEFGIEGLVVTNHYQKSYLNNTSIENFINEYINEYNYLKQLGEKHNIKIYHGTEVTMELYPNVHLLVYGTDESFYKNDPYMFDYTQKKLYERVKKQNGALIQAHPFRNGTTVLDTKYLDGLEINCHPLYEKTYCDELLEIAKNANISITCGGDYHGDTNRPKCGIYINEAPKDSFELKDYILNTKQTKLCVFEPSEESSKDIVYSKF